MSLPITILYRASVRTLKRGLWTESHGENWLATLERGLEKCGGCLPSFCRCVGTITVRALFIAERMGGVFVGSDFDTFLVFECRCTKPVHILPRHPLVLTSLMVEHWTE